MDIVIDSVLTFDEEKIPVEGTPEFRSNASYVWSQINPVLNSFNLATGQINSAYSDMEQFRNESYEYKDNAMSYSENAKSYSDDANVARNEAISAAAEIKEYVVPEESTLSEDAIIALVENHRKDIFLGFNF